MVDVYIHPSIFDHCLSCTQGCGGAGYTLNKSPVVTSNIFCVNYAFSLVSGLLIKQKGKWTGDSRSAQGESWQTGETYILFTERPQPRNRGQDLEAAVLTTTLQSYL